MRILLDESLPKSLKRELSDHDVVTVPERGWASIKNGVLLRLMQEEFDVFITADRNMQYQQPLTKLPIRFVVLIARDNQIETYLPLVPRLLELLPTLQPGTVTQIQDDHGNG